MASNAGIDKRVTPHARHTRAGTVSCDDAEGDGRHDASRHMGVSSMRGRDDRRPELLGAQPRRGESPSLTRCSPPDRPHPTLGDRASTSKAGRRASGLLLVSLSKVTRHPQWCLAPSSYAESLPTNASDCSLLPGIALLRTPVSCTTGDIRAATGCGDARRSTPRAVRETVEGAQ